jgi:hypothetical protein
MFTSFCTGASAIAELIKLLAIAGLAAALIVFVVMLVLY